MDMIVGAGWMRRGREEVGRNECRKIEDEKI